MLESCCATQVQGHYGEHHAVSRGLEFRELVGIFRNSRLTKRPKLADNSIVDQVMAEVDQPLAQEGVQLLHSLQQQVMQLARQQGVAKVDTAHGQSVQPAQG